MSKSNASKLKRRLRRRMSIRARVHGTAERPRLSVFRSLTGVYAQLIDDEAGKTLMAVHSKKVDASKADAGERSGKIAVAYALGKAIAEQAKAANVQVVVFDRGGFAYHGRVKAVAEGARDGGLQF